VYIPSKHHIVKLGWGKPHTADTVAACARKRCLRTLLKLVTRNFATEKDTRIQDSGIDATNALGHL
jgi:hypothetical protein